MPCPHEEFEAHVAVARITDSEVWYADLTVTCSKCGQKMEFLGAPMGLSPTQPMMDVTGTELRIPFVPHEAERVRRRLGLEAPETAH